MPATVSQIEEAMEEGSRFFAAIKSLAEFDRQRLRPILQGQLNLADREKCFLGLYSRVCVLINSLLKLNDIKDFQATVLLSRSILELGIDLRLLSLRAVPDDAQKIIAFNEVEKLKSAGKLIELRTRRPDLTRLDVSVHQEWVNNNASRVEAEHERLWGRDRNGKLKRITHWSNMDLSQRAQQAGGDFEHWHGELYTLCNWHVHSGLAGFLGVEAGTFVSMQGMAFRWVCVCYRMVLEMIVQEFRLERGDTDILKHLQLAYYLPWTNSTEQVRQLQAEILG